MGRKHQNNAIVVKNWICVLVLSYFGIGFAGSRRSIPSADTCALWLGLYMDERLYFVVRQVARERLSLHLCLKALQVEPFLNRFWWKPIVKYHDRNLKIIFLYSYY